MHHSERQATCLQWSPQQFGSIVQLGRATAGLLSWWRQASVRRQSGGRLRVPQEIGVAGYSLLAVPVATFALGTWQVRRRRWKLQLIEDLQSKTTQPPAAALPEDLSQLATMEYRRVRLVGSFDHEREMYVGPRSPIEPAGEAPRRGVLAAPTQTGNLVITPFKLRDRDLTILVNRGWVPKSKTSVHKRPEGQIRGEVELVGIVRMTETRPPLGPKQPSSGRFWHYKDVAQMAEASGAAPVLVDAVAVCFFSAAQQQTARGSPGSCIGRLRGSLSGRAHCAEAEVCERHTMNKKPMDYGCVHLYSLSAATAFLWYHKYIRRRPLM
ncbi:hypothetical protein HPB48_020277 [Haemaphysalis longicornis]|uniref:SURF1-like protein n=1 Tax=Haemaphysalis longicornis TaxID=44386 RepID=A0A9J6FBF3_HAELO|nr:hypothetical protein HPB48_020277 [Haemaphysalis longicornis]